MKKIITFLAIAMLLILSKPVFAQMQDISYQTPILIIYQNDIEEHYHYEYIFDSVSLDYDEIRLVDININEIKKYEVLIVTKGIIDLMSDELIMKINELVLNEGLNIVLEGKTKLSKLIGVEYIDEELKISQVRDLKHNEIEFNLQIPLIIEKFKKDSEFFGMYDYITKHQFLSAFSHGEGKVIYLATHVGYEGSEGYKIYPYLHEYICEYFQIQIPIVRNSLVAYVDWGYYYDKDPFKLAKGFKAQGINEIHVSGWYDVGDYYVFMDKFVDACHSYGILVYAWLEYPMVTSSFYDENPEFWETTFLLTNDHYGGAWRKLVALDNLECKEAVKEHAYDFINRYEFDGIDFAELYYELPVADEGGIMEFDKPGLTELEKFMLKFYTPMNDYFRSTYESEKGYDPALLFVEDSKYFFKKNDLIYFNEFVEHRRELVKSLNDEFITYFKNEEYFGEGLDIIVTQIDSIFDDNITVETGVSADDFIDLQNKHEFTFMIEDPFSLWVEGPSRYTKIGQKYGSKMSSYDKFFIDINIVCRDKISFDDKKPYPHDKQTGLEFAMLISEASKSASKVCIYSEQTPYRFDYDYVTNSLASMVEIENGDDSVLFSSSHEFEFLTDLNDKDVYIDDKLWPAITDGGVLINSGDHELKIGKEKTRDFHIRDINVDFEKLEYFEEGIYLKRKSDQNMFVTLNKKPAMVVADGKEVEVETFYTQGNYILYFNFEANDIYIYENGMNFSNVSVFINGKEQVFSSEIEIIANRCFLPAEEILDIIGAKYEIHTEFNDPTIFGEYNGYVFWMQANNKEAKENGNDLQMDVNPYYKYKENKFMLPIRYVFESLDFEVEWKCEDYMVLIK